MSEKNSALHRNFLLKGATPTPEQEAELDFLDRDGLLLDDATFRQRREAGLPVYPEPGA